MPNKCDAYAYILIINSLQVSEQYIICTWNIIIISFVVRTVLAADRRSRGKRPGNARNRSAIYRNSKTIC